MTSAERKLLLLLAEWIDRMDTVEEVEKAKEAKRALVAQIKKESYAQ